MRDSRTLEWIANAEARQMMTIAQSEARPKMPRAGPVRRPRSLGWLRRLFLFLFPAPPLPRLQPVRIDARIRRGSRQVEE